MKIFKKLAYTLILLVITKPDNSLYITIIPQYAEGNHYNAIKGELFCFGDATCFCFLSDSSFASK